MVEVLLLDFWKRRRRWAYRRGRSCCWERREEIWDMSWGLPASRALAFARGRRCRVRHWRQGKERRGGALLGSGWWIVDDHVVVTAVVVVVVLDVLLLRVVWSIYEMDPVVPILLEAVGKLS